MTDIREKLREKIAQHAARKALRKSPDEIKREAKKRYEEYKKARDEQRQACRSTAVRARDRG